MLVHWVNVCTLHTDSITWDRYVYIYVCIFVFCKINIYIYNYIYFMYIYIYGSILLCLNNTTHIHASRTYLNKLIGEDVPGSHCNMFAGHHWRLPQNMDTLMQTWLDPSPDDISFYWFPIFFDVPNSIFNIVFKYIYIFISLGKL